MKYHVTQTLPGDRLKQYRNGRDGEAGKFNDDIGSTQTLSVTVRRGERVWHRTFGIANKLIPFLKQTIRLRLRLVNRQFRK